MNPTLPGRFKSCALACFFVLLATVILIASLFRSSTLEYEFRLLANTALNQPDLPDINYQLPYPGRIQPTSLFWPFKVLRDKFVLSLSTNSLKKAQLNLLLADKRLMSGVWLLDKGEYEESAKVFYKSELYLEKSYEYARTAHGEGQDVAVFSQVLALASLKHREVLEKNISYFPEDAQPVLNQIVGNVKQVFEKTSQLINESGSSAPVNPFDY